MVTLDADFGDIRRFPPARTPGVVWIRVHPPTEESVNFAIRRLLAEIPKIDPAGKLVVVTPRKIRIRV